MCRGRTERAGGAVGGSWCVPVPLVSGGVSRDGGVGNELVQLG